MASQKYLTVPHLTRWQLKRLFSKIRITSDGCWEWQGRRTSERGYGRVMFKGRAELCHRLMYAWAVEAIPRGLGRTIPQLDHIVCDNPPCCNPSHLKLVSGRENTRRSRSFAGRNARKTHCLRGHLLPSEPNDARSKKRDCHECWTVRRHLMSKDQRTRYLAYLRKYRATQQSGPRRQEMLAKARESQKRQYYGPKHEEIKRRGREAARKRRLAKMPLYQGRLFP